MSIQNELNKVKNAVYGSEVRGAIHDALQKTYDDASEKGNANMEVSLARGTHPNLNARLNNVDSKVNDTNRQLAQKVDESDLNQAIGGIAEGTPLFADSVNNMTDQSRLYVNTSDGMIYRYDGSSFINTGRQYQSTGIANNSIGFSEIKSNSVDTSSMSENILGNDLVELFDIKKVEKGKTINANGEIVDYGSTHLTDYIYVPIGATLIFTVGGVDGFQRSDRRIQAKLGVWNSNLEFVSETRLNDLSGFTAEMNCFVRIAYEADEQAISLKTTKTKKIKSTILENDSIFDYQTDELIEFFQPKPENLNKAYRDLTGELYEVNGFMVTDFIALPAYHKLLIWFDNEFWKDSSVTDANSTKIVVFDKNKQWEETIRLRDFHSNIVFGQDKYIRLSLYQGPQMSIKVDGLNKIDSRYIHRGTQDIIVDKDTGYDVFVFMGQSNMAGRGVQTSEHPETAPDVSDIAYEYRAITAPNTLTPLVEPFGRNENTPDGIDDGAMKTGSMVSSFAKKYNELTGKKLIGISASKGGSSIDLWQVGQPLMTDTIQRVQSFNQFSEDHGLKINSFNMVWNQGESNVTRDRESYEASLNNIIEELQKHGVEKCMLIRIGQTDMDQDGEVDDDPDYLNMMKIQSDICRSNPNFILIGNIFGSLARDGYLKDYVHFTQAGYNIQGEQAGINAAYYLNNAKEPVIYDKEFDELYFSLTGY